MNRSLTFPPRSRGSRARPRSPTARAGSSTVVAGSSTMQGPARRSPASSDRRSTTLASLHAAVLVEVDLPGPELRCRRGHGFPLDRFAPRGRDAHARLDELDRGRESERICLLGRGVETIPQAFEEVRRRSVRRRAAPRACALARRIAGARTARCDARPPPARAPPRPRARARRTEAPSAVRSSGPTCVRTASARKSPSSIPSAEKWPGAGGITVRATPSSRASSAACSGPAPPNATNVKSRGSCPRRSVTSRSACDICATTVAEDASGRRRGVHAHPPAEPRQASMRRVDVERHRAAEEVRGIEPTGDQVRVGERGLLAASAVARRAGFGARAPGTDVEATGIVHPRDRAAARPDLDDLDDRRLDRIAGARRGPLDVMQGLDRHAPATDRRRLGSRAADVQGQDIVDAEPPAELGRGGHPGDRAGLEQRDGRLGRAFERRDAAARPHRVQGCLDAGASKPRCGDPRDRWRPSASRRPTAPTCSFARTRATGRSPDARRRSRRRAGASTGARRLGAHARGSSTRGGSTPRPPRRRARVAVRPATRPRPRRVERARPRCARSARAPRTAAGVARTARACGTRGCTGRAGSRGRSRARRGSLPSSRAPPGHRGVR